MKCPAESDKILLEFIPEKCKLYSFAKEVSPVQLSFGFPQFNTDCFFAKIIFNGQQYFRVK